MELARLFYGRRGWTALSKFLLLVLIFVFGFSLFVSGPKIEPTGEFDSEKSLAEEINEKFAQKYKSQRFISQYYEEKGTPYDNYCQIEMESRILRAKEMCDLYLNSEESKSLENALNLSDTDEKMKQFRLFLGKTEANPVLVGARFLERKELAKRPDLMNAELELNRKMFLCAPHKVGSQTWRHFFERLKLRDGMNETDIFQPKTEFPSDIITFMKAYQVRHPFERLLSAYRFIFEREVMRMSIRDLNKEIIRSFPFTSSESQDSKFYPNESNYLVPRNEHEIIPNFRQFAEYVIHSGPDFGQAQYPVVSHWMPYYFSCSPCQGDFRPDIIIRMESILKDTLCFLDSIPSIDWEDLSKLHHINQSPNGHSSNKELQRSYFQMLSKGIIQDLYNRYKPDFLLYGYTPDEFLEMASP